MAKQCLCEQPGETCPLHGEVAWDGDRGPVAPIAPDPDRDRRVDAYRDRERRRAVRALDRYIEVMNGPDLDASATRAVAGDRFIEAVGDYVLARLDDRCTCDDPEQKMWPHGVHQKGHYGVQLCTVDSGCTGHCRGLATCSSVQYDTGHDSSGVRESLDQTGSETGARIASARSVERVGSPSDAERGPRARDGGDLRGRSGRSGSNVQPVIMHHKADYGVAPTTGAPYADVYQDEPAPVAAATDGATMPHPTCADVSRLNEPLGSRWACTAACPR